jgi:predicted AAA+ superfamily ATPase
MAVTVDRPNGLAMLRRWRDRPVIKVVTGVRRCGKSTLLDLFRTELIAGGVPEANTAKLSLEDVDNAELAADHRLLHQWVVSRLAESGTTYVFLDEIQLVDGFEKAVNSLLLRSNVDLYLTGSNASLLSGELATLLAGRYVELPLLPLSFAEFVDGRRHAPDSSITALYAEYVRFGEFPFVVNLLPDSAAVRDYLQGLLNTVLLKDVVARKGVSNVAALEDVIRFLMHNIGALTSLRRVSAGLDASGRRPSATTVDSYLDALTKAYLFYPVRRWDLKGLRFLAGPEKYYSVDPGLRAALLGFSGGDTGHVLENVVFLELLRRSLSVRTGAAGGEIYFVVGEGAETAYYQVAETVRDPSTLQRELAPLADLRDHHPKYLLTLDQAPPVSHNGITQLFCLDWLLGQ